MVNELTPATGTRAPPQGSTIMSPRSLDAGRGASWWSEGWRLFTPSVGAWLLITIILVVIHLALAFVPFIGQLVSQIVFPVFVGGLMLGCRAIDRGNPLMVGHLFAGFSQRTGPLFVVGIIYTALVFVIVLVVGALLAAFFGASVLSALLSAGGPDFSNFPFSSLVSAILVGALLFMALLLPLVMAVWFAPALVVLGGLEAGAAMKASFNGCMRNIVPYLIYGLVGIVLAIVASIPFGLGWFILAPVTIASIYTSYCDIFEEADTTVPGAPSAATAS